jgi:Lon protease-like protein
VEIPLFPLHTVLCPGIVLPLHVFEERYRALTRHCLATGEPFGVVLIREGREVGAVKELSLAGVGALVEIREAGRYPDGRYDLLAAATGRFVIDKVDTVREPYLIADVTPLDDEVGDEVRAERLAASAIRRFVRYLELMRAREGETTEVLDIRVELDSSPLETGEGAGSSREEPPRASRPFIPTEIDDATAIDDDEDDDAIDDDDDEATSSSAGARRDLVIPDDPTVLSYLLSGIVQIELPRRQALLEASTTTERLEGLIKLLDREVLLLGRRLRLFTPDPRLLGGPRRS